MFKWYNNCCVDVAGGFDTTSTSSATTESQKRVTVEPSTTTTTGGKTTKNLATTEQLSLAYTSTALPTNNQATVSTSVATTKESPASTNNIFRSSKSAQETTQAPAEKTTGIPISAKKQSTTADAFMPITSPTNKASAISAALNYSFSTTFKVVTKNFTLETFFTMPSKESVPETTQNASTLPLITFTRNKSSAFTTATSTTTTLNLTSENKTKGFSYFSSTFKPSSPDVQIRTTIPAQSDVTPTVVEGSSESFTTPFDTVVSTLPSATFSASHQLKATESSTSTERGSTQFSGVTTHPTITTTRLTTFLNSFDPISTRISSDPLLFSISTSSVSSYTDTINQPNTVSTFKISAENVTSKKSSTPHDSATSEIATTSVVERGETSDHPTTSFSSLTTPTRSKVFLKSSEQTISFSLNPTTLTVNLGSSGTPTNTTLTVSKEPLAVDTTTAPVTQSTTENSTRAGAINNIGSVTSIDVSSSTELLQGSTTSTNQVSTEPDPFVRVASKNNGSTFEANLLSAHTTTSPVGNAGTEILNKPTVGVGVRIIPAPVLPTNQTSTSSVSQTTKTTAHNTTGNPKFFVVFGKVREENCL